MAVNIKGRSFLTLKDFSGEEIRYLLDLARDLKSKKRAGIVGESLKGKNIVLMFDKTSTRTRCSFEVAARDEGAGVTYLDKSSSQVSCELLNMSDINTSDLSFRFITEEKFIQFIMTWVA